MIPIKLQLKNFLSYGSEIQTIDFSTYALICLSGKNGHGKSALLDAITWALWGQARKVSATTKADQGLVRLGQTQMMVILDFSCAGQVYRIRREYMITYGKPQAVLEFGILNDKNNTISSLTDKTIRDTQEKIEKTIRIDFNSFCNSAFLRQGNANEFSQKSPKDRKEILATILGLDHYDLLKRRALEKAKNASLECNALEVMQRKGEEELKEQDALSQQLNELESARKALDTEEKICTQQLHAIHDELTLVHHEQQKKALLTFTLKQLDGKRIDLQKQLDTTTEQWTLLEQKKNTIEDLQELKNKHTQAVKCIIDYQTKLQATLTHKEQLLELKEKLHRLTQEHHHTQSLVLREKNREIERFETELTNKIATQHTLSQQNETLVKELALHKKEYAELERYADSVYQDEARYVNLKNRFEKRKLFYHNFLSQGTFANNELDQLKKKIVLADDDNAPSCALCEQNLSASRKRFLKNKFFTTKKMTIHRIQRLKRIVEKLKHLLVADHKTLEFYHQQKEQHSIATIKKSQINQAMVQKGELIAHTTNECNLYDEIINQHKQEKITFHAELETLITQQAQLLTNSSAYVQTRDAIKATEEFLQSNPYHAQEHQKTQKELECIEKKITEFQEIQKKLDQQDERAQKIKTIAAELHALENEINDTTKNISPYNQLAVTQQLLLEKKQITEQQEKRNNEQKNELLEQRGSLTMKKTRLEQTAQELAQHQKMLTELEKIKKDYLAIAVATGKDGIQALLIENAIPEIEQEANLLLAKLTNNQSQILIESLRDLKKGGTKETLDIKISDSYGIRPYEMFSGGEAFRIDFALRIAISKLLARRAGTSLQTLIIDEGFGSQDEEGLSNIMDALHKIQEDFQKLLSSLTCLP